jgi:hypothetical protein
MPYDNQSTVTVRRETQERLRAAAQRMGLTYDTLLSRLLEEGLPSVREGRVKEISEEGGGG